MIKSKAIKMINEKEQWINYEEMVKNNNDKNYILSKKDKNNLLIEYINSDNYLSKNIFIFKAIPSGDYENECFAVTPELYERITNSKLESSKEFLKKLGLDYIEDIDPIYPNSNPFYKELVSLYLYEIYNNDIFNGYEILSRLIRENEEVCIFIPLDKEVE